MLLTSQYRSYKNVCNIAHSSPEYVPNIVCIVCCSDRGGVILLWSIMFKIKKLLAHGPVIICVASVSICSSTYPMSNRMISTARACKCPRPASNAHSTPVPIHLVHQH